MQCRGLPYCCCRVAKAMETWVGGGIVLHLEPPRPGSWDGRFVVEDLRVVRRYQARGRGDDSEDIDIRCLCCRSASKLGVLLYSGLWIWHRPGSSHAPWDRRR